MLKRTTCLILGMALTLPALADTHITFVDDQGKTATQIFVKGDKVRVEGSDSAGKGIGLYDAASNSMTVLMPGEKKYLVFDSASAAQVRAQADTARQARANAQAQMAQHQAQLDEANRQMEAASANLSPEQKAMMQQMMAQRAGAAAPDSDGGPLVQTNPLGTSETVAGHPCKDVQLTVNGRPSSTLCVIRAPGELGIDAADLKTLQAMRDGMQKLMSQMGMMGQSMATMMGTGFSLKTTRQFTRNFQTVTQTETFKSASNASLGSTLFQIPDGYQQTTIQEMMQGGGHP